MMEGLDNRNGRASLRQSIRKSAPNLWSGFGRWIALWAIILAIFGCSGGSGCSSCGGTSEDGSTSSGLGCSSAADPKAPPKMTVTSPSFNPNTLNDTPAKDVDGNITVPGIPCDLCGTFDIRLNNTLNDYINATITDLLTDPTTAKVLTALINDLATDGEALFEFVFGLDPLLDNMCMALYIENNDAVGSPASANDCGLGQTCDADPLAFKVDPNIPTPVVGLVTDVANKALKIQFSLDDLSLDFRFKTPTETGEKDCAALDAAGNPIPSPTDATKYQPDPDLFVHIDTDANIPNIDLTVMLRPLAGDPAEFIRHNANDSIMCPDVAGGTTNKLLCACANGLNNRLCPAVDKGGTWLAIELPSLDLKAGLSLQLIAPPSDPTTSDGKTSKATKTFARLLPFAQINIGAKLTNAFKSDVAKYFGPTPIMNIGDLLGGLLGGSSGSSGGSSCGCALIGRESTSDDLTASLPILLLVGWLALRRKRDGRPS